MRRQTVQPEGAAKKDRANADAENHRFPELIPSFEKAGDNAEKARRINDRLDFG